MACLYDVSNDLGIGSGSSNYQHTMEMVRHDDMPIQLSFRKMTGDLVPTFVNDLSHSGQPNVSIYNRPEQWSPVISAQREEVRTITTIIVSTQPNRTAATTSDAEISAHAGG